MKKDELIKKFEELMKDVAVNDYYKKKCANRVNCYSCGKCRHITKTIDIHPGCTPMMNECEECNYYGAMSSGYRDIAPNKSPTKEWYRPELEEFLKLSKDYIDHVMNGGLIIRDIRINEKSLTLIPKESIQEKHLNYGHLHFYKVEENTMFVQVPKIDSFQDIDAEKYLNDGHQGFDQLSEEEQKKFLLALKPDDLQKYTKLFIEVWNGKFGKKMIENELNKMKPLEDRVVKKKRPYLGFMNKIMNNL